MLKTKERKHELLRLDGIKLQLGSELVSGLSKQSYAVRQDGHQLV